jgi:hypothetical protein
VRPAPFGGRVLIADKSAWERASDPRCAGRGWRRCARGAGVGVLHEDAHFDVLARVLDFESVRLLRA